MAQSNKLSAAKIRTLNAAGRYGDGGGLWLQVTEGVNGPTKAWLFRYMIDGRARQMGLGPLDTFSLAEARERALAARKQVKDGIDPIEAREAVRQARRAADAKRITFKEAAERYIAAHRNGWKNKKHSAQWVATLQTYAFPKLGALAVDVIDTGNIIDAIEPVWMTKPETASRVRGRIEAILDWATVRSYRHGDNPARWRGHLDKLLPKRARVRAVVHHEALPFSEVGFFMADLRERDGISARALEFTILTAARTGETIGARWSEIDLETKVWTVPGDRTKSSKEHQVPLSERAVQILQDLPRLDDAGFVFPGARRGKALSNMAMLELVRGMRKGLTVHGFRSTFRDWAGDQTNFPREVAEAALSHIVKDKAEAAYRRGSALEKRRRLMDAWARYCISASIKESGRVVSIAGVP